VSSAKTDAPADRTSFAVMDSPCSFQECRNRQAVEFP
jgi:hypothetical protein